MVAELETSKVPRIVYNDFEEFKNNPQIMWDWIYKVSEEIQKNASNSTTNVGDMKIIGTDNVPAGWLIADGSTKQTEMYPALQKFLFPDISDTTFVLPNLQAFIADNTTGSVFSLDTAVKSPFTVIIKI